MNASAQSAVKVCCHLTLVCIGYYFQPLPTSPQPWNVKYGLTIKGFVAKLISSLLGFCSTCSCLVLCTV